jgi:hypothetical protein
MSERAYGFSVCRAKLKRTGEIKVGSKRIQVSGSILKSALNGQVQF